MKQENQAELTSMKRENQELKARMDQNNQILLQALKAIHTGMVSAELLDAAELALRVGDSQRTDPAEIEKIIDNVISANPKQVEQYRGAKTKLQGFFAGQELKGKANPGLLNKILLEKLNAKDL